MNKVAQAPPVPPQVPHRQPSRKRDGSLPGQPSKPSRLGTIGTSRSFTAGIALATMRPAHCRAALRAENMTKSTAIIVRAIPILDQAAQALAWLAGKVSPVRGAGVFWVTGVPGVVDSWREPGAWTARLGRLELVVDLPR